MEFEFMLSKENPVFPDDMKDSINIQSIGFLSVKTEYINLITLSLINNGKSVSHELLAFENNDVFIGRKFIGYSLRVIFSPSDLISSVSLMVKFTEINSEPEFPVYRF
jgi:hypothetical protein